MSQVCELTGKRPAYGNKVSHSNIKTRTRWMPNLKSKKYIVPELGRAITLLLSTRAIRTIDKFGNLTDALMKAKDEGISMRLMQVKREIYKTRVKRSASGKTAAAAPKAAAPKAKKTKKA